MSQKRTAALIKKDGSFEVNSHRELNAMASGRPHRMKDRMEATEIENSPAPIIDDE